MEKLFRYLDRYHPLSAACRDRLRQVVRRLELPAGKKVITSGEVCDNVYFLDSGCVLCYEVVAGRVRNIWGTTRPRIFISMEGYCFGEASRDNVVVFGDSVLYYVSKRELDKLYDEFAELILVSVGVVKGFQRLVKEGIGEDVFAADLN